MALALLPAACKTQPPPTGAEIRQQALPHLAFPEGWRAGIPDSGPVQDNWLATFGDADLDSLVREAIARNPDVTIAAARVEQAAGYLDIASASLRPWVNLAGTGGLRMAGGDLSSALQGLLLGVSWEPDLWGRLRYAKAAAAEELVSSGADLEFARQSLAAAVAKAWFAATETQLHLGIAVDTVATAQSLVGLAETRVNIGAGTEEEIALALASLGGYEDAVQQLSLAHDQALRALEILVGRYPAAELDARGTFVRLPGPVPAGIPLGVLERRPDLVAAERRVAAAFDRVGEAKAAMLPRITLNTGISVLDSDVLELKEDYENPSIGAGARLVAPIYQGGSLRAQVVIRTAEQREAVGNYARAALRALGDVESALASSKTLSEREDILRRVVAYNERALSLTETSFRVGRADLRTVQEQQLRLFTSRSALLRVESEQLAQRVNLHLALGGSFEAPVLDTVDQPTSARQAGVPAATPPNLGDADF